MLAGVARRNWKDLFQYGDDMSSRMISQLETLEDDIQTLQSGGSGALTLLSTTTRATDGPFDVTGISQAYNDLVCVLVARGTNASATDTLKWNFNGDSGNNYAWQETMATATTASPVGVGATAQLAGGRVPGATASASSSFGALELVIFGYAATAWGKACTWQSHSTSVLAGTNSNTGTGGGYWNNTAAVTRV